MFFNKSALLAFVTLSLSALSVQAAAVESSCAVPTTVTVTASAVVTAKTLAAVSTTTKAAAATTTAAAASPTGAAAATGGDLQKSLTLDPSVIQKYDDNGQSPPVAGQTPSLTSTNNYIDFCKGKTITNGIQNKAGSCNVTPMGLIPAKTKMTSAKFAFPANFGTIKANTAFTVKLNIKNLATGSFTNAASTYYAAPQTLDKTGTIIGHSHITIEAIDSLGSTKPLTPTKFAFFKGVNNAAVGGALTADVSAGLPAGVYRMSTINSAANHQSVLMPIAQHGVCDDAIYFTVTADGAAAADPAASASATGAASATATAKTTAAAAATSAAAVVSTTSAAAPAATSAAVAAPGGANFGSCSTPQIKFAAGLDGRVQTSFQAVDQKSFNHGSALNIGVISDFICQQLATSCKANTAAVATCTKAKAASAAASNGAAADAFNAAFGVKSKFSDVKVVTQ